MAKQGSLHLSNEVLIGMFENVRNSQAAAQEDLYSLYKTAFKISVSNYFRGEGAKAFKNYVKDGTINVISGLLDITSDLTMVIQLMAEAFFQYEQTHNGHVDEGVLDYIVLTIESKKNTIDGASTELESAVKEASKYISTAPLKLSEIEDEYTKVKDIVKTIREDLYQVDKDALDAANELFTRIHDVRTLIEKLMAFCYNSDGQMQESNMGSVSSQSWFTQTGNVTLYLLLQEDPFEYAVGEVSLSEDQWAIGLCSDVYAYAGYKFLTASGEYGVEDGTAFAKGKAAVLQANGYAQFTDYLSLQANVKVAYAEGEVKAGFSDKYVGFKAEGDVGLFKADGSFVLGSDDLNAFVKGEVKVLCADGKAAFEFEDKGQFAIGVDASASGAAASVKGGTTILGYKNKDVATGETETLLGFKFSAKAGVDASFALWAESKTAIETEYVNVNATRVKIGAAALLGVDLDVTIPTLYFNDATIAETPVCDINITNMSLGVVNIPVPYVSNFRWPW